MKENDKKRGAIAAMAAGGKLLARGGAGAALAAAQMQEYVDNFQQMRMTLYAEDRFNTLRALDVMEWKRFSIRWNIIPTFPHGFGDDDTLRRLMHTTRLFLAFDPKAKDHAGFNMGELIASAEWLTERNFDLPFGLSFTNGKIVGEVKLPSSQE